MDQNIIDQIRKSPMSVMTSSGLLMIALGLSVLNDKYRAEGVKAAKDLRRIYAGLIERIDELLAMVEKPGGVQDSVDTANPAVN